MADNSNMRHQQCTTVTQRVPSVRQDIIQDRAPTNKTSNLYPLPAAQIATPSSSISGFFQAPPRIPNQFHEDHHLHRALTLFLPASTLARITPELTDFATEVLSPQVQSWILDAERNPPYVKTFDTWGRRRDELITSTGWQRLQDLGIATGIVAIPYENRFGEYSRIHGFAKYALWVGSAAWVNCPSLMVDGVASMLRKQLCDQRLEEQQRRVLRSAYDRLVSREVGFAWTTGQWMTERQGGSDVSMTETLATYSPVPGGEEKTKATDGYDLGPWLLNGFKWFSSATDANMMVLLARTPKGLSLFYAPMRKMLAERDVLGNDTELNGVYIQRLKNKLGTKALPTAELELKGVRAWLVGEEGRGTKEIATVLNIARIHNGVTAIGFWGRGLSIVRAFTRVRVVGRRPLWERTAFMRNLAKMHVEYQANVLFNFFVAGLLGVVEQEQIATFTGKDYTITNSLGQVPGLQNLTMAEHLLRLLTPALKGHCSKTAIAGLQECMECMGGVGYLENEDMQFNIARLYRDANVLPIWEGTTDMMADDSVLRVLYGKMKEPVMESLGQWTDTMRRSTKQSRRFSAQTSIVSGWWTELETVVAEASRDEAELKSRAIMTKLVDIIQGLLLLKDASRDNDEIAGLVTEAWFAEKQNGGVLEIEEDWKSQTNADLRIVFGAQGPSAATTSRMKANL